MPQVSLILPVFNVERFLYKCFDSLINQSLSEIQIIFIDDCSTDDSFKIVQQFKSNDSRVEVYRLENNSGPAVARNFGLKKARGNYVQFIDPDDIIPFNAVEKLYNSAALNSADLVRGNGVFFQHGNAAKLSPMQNVSWVKDASELNYENENFHGLPFYHPIFLFNKHFLLMNKIRYPELRSGEDPIFLLEALLAAGKVNTVAETVYLYRVYKKTDDRFKASYEYRDHFLHYLKIKEIWLKRGMSARWQEYFNMTFWWFWRNYVSKNQGVVIENFNEIKALFSDLTTEDISTLKDTELTYINDIRKMELSEFTAVLSATFK